MGKAADDASRRAETKPPGSGSKIYKILGVVTDVSGDGNTKKKELWEAGDRAGSKAAADLVTASGSIISKAKGETRVVTNISANSNNNSWQASC